MPLPPTGGPPPEGGPRSGSGEAKFEQGLLSNVAADVWPQAPLGQLGRLPWRHSPG